MMFFNPALTEGGQFFIWLVILLKAVAVAVAYVDYRKSCKACSSKEEPTKENV